MAYTVTGLSLFSELCYHLLETPVDGSAEPVSLLYTRAEMMARLNYRLAEFNQRAGVVAKEATATVTISTRAVNLPTDIIDPLQVAFAATTTVYNVLPKGSTLEADLFISNTITGVTTPSIYTMDVAPVETLSLIPPPAATNSTGLLVTYLMKAAALPSPADSTIANCPDDLTPFVKYGALADLFGKAGETYDPQRQAICEQLFDLGVDAGRHWVSGAQS
jgi:hypothetical protein